MVSVKPRLNQADVKLLKGIFATKDDLKKLATKDDLKDFATKIDLLKMERRLKLHVSKAKIDLATRISRVATSSPTIKMFNDLEGRINRYHPTN